MGESRLCIEDSFGSLEKFYEDFKECALSLFGSGWTWLVFDGSKMHLLKTHNAHTPLTDHLYPLLTLDVWEHAYYPDYQNRRADYTDVFLSKLVNWDFANQRMSAFKPM